jgi:hypothetical protein
MATPGRRRCEVCSMKHRDRERLRVAKKKAAGGRW